MIFDTLENASLYKGIHPNLDEALDFIANGTYETLPSGRYTLDGDRLFYLIQAYATKPELSAEFEAHKRYIDIQLMLEGEERMGFSNVSACVPSTEYSSENDFTLYSGSPNWVLVKKRTFAIFFPDDAHMPGIENSASQEVKKMVVKVAVR